MIAITRAVSPTLAQCQLTHLPRTAIDAGRATAQHGAYEDALRGLGVQVVRARPAPELPDAVFVEDIAVVVDEAAVITLPGAPSRLEERPGVAEALAPYRRPLFIEDAGRIDGGDVLRVGKTLYVGQSARTNNAGIAQFRELLEPLGYRVQGVSVTGCLHLKSAVTQVAADTLLINPAWVRAEAFSGMKFIEIDPTESHAANALLVKECVIYPEHFPRTRARLAAADLRVITINYDELAKAEGALTCCSLLLE